MTPTRPKLFLERFPDPLTGWPMLGVGVTWDETPDDADLEIAYDGVTRLAHPITSSASGTQLPVESTATTFQVTLRQGGSSTPLHDGPLESVPDRPTAPADPPRRPKALSPLFTTLKAAKSGDLVTRRWWQARLDRYTEIARKSLNSNRIPRVQPRPSPAYEAQRRLARCLDSAPRQVASSHDGPTFSVLVPVYNTDPRWLTEAVMSVQAQTYSRWQLVLADDASTRPETLKVLGRFADDPRVVVVRRGENGHIVAASQSAAAAATSEFICLLDHDDALDPDALSYYADIATQNPDVGIIYSDEDKLTEDGHHYDPHFKPDFSPELLLSYNYINHLTCVRRTVFDAVGGFRTGTDGAQDYDLLLRCIQHTIRVVHVPKILYHWRAVAESTATAAAVKPYVHTSAVNAVKHFLQAQSIDCEVEHAEFARPLGLPVLALTAPAATASVAVIVTGRQADRGHTTAAVKAITGYDRYRVVGPEASPVTAAAQNGLAASCHDDVLIFLDGGLAPATPDWIERTLAHLALPGVGVVGGLVVGGAGEVLSAGTLRGTRPRHAFAGQSPRPVSYFFLAESARTVTAPGRGFLAVTRTTFEQLGGFDATTFPESLHQVDLCLRLAKLGLRSVHVGQVRLVADAARYGRHDAPSECRELLARHGDTADPYYHPHLADNGSFLPDVLPKSWAVPAPAVPPGVLFVTHNLTALEGAPKVLRDVATGLAGRGELRATLTAPRVVGNEVRDPEFGLLPSEVTSADHFRDGQWTPRALRQTARELTALLSVARPELVVANTIGLFPYVLAARSLGIPAVWVVHESLTPTRLAATLSPAGLDACHRALEGATFVVFVSESCRDLYARHDSGGRFRVITNAIDLSVVDQKLATLTRHDRTPVNFLAVGTVCERKAQHVVIEAGAVAARARTDFRVTLLGARERLPYLSYCEHLIRARGLTEIVELVAETPDVWDHYRRADVFVCASHVEAYSLSVLEAMAAGLPVVSTPCGGLGEQAVWGHTARRFEFDAADQLAGLMLDLIADPFERLRLGREGRLAAEMLPTPGAMLDEYARLFRVALRCRP